MTKFDPTKPNNNLPVFPFEFDFKDTDILIQLGKTNVELAKLNEMAQRIPNQKILLDFISIKEGVDSNEIENVNTTIQDAFIAELEEDKKRIKKADKETIHYKDAIYHGYNQIKSRGFLNTNDYEKINNILLENNAGIITSPDKKITNNKTGEILYTPPQGIELIRSLLKNFEDYYNLFDGKKEIDPLLKLPLLHYQFEAIHPFGDGNGRTGRIITVLYLVLHEKLDLPILFLSDFIFEFKDEYYKYLHAIDEGKKGAYKTFIMWMLLGIQIKALDTRNVIYQMIILMSKTKKIFKDDSELCKIDKSILDYLFIRPVYSIEGLEKFMNVHRNTASTYLNLLEKKGLVISFKNNKNRIFFYKDFLDLLKGKMT